MRPRIALLATAALVLFAQVAPASAAGTFRPRIGGAMGIVPPRGSTDIAIGSNFPVVFHGGDVMRPPVTIHTVFWAPSGYSFEGSPGPGILAYKPMIEQFLSDAAHDSGTTSNIFSILGQYPDLSGGNGYQFAYDAATDSIGDTDPYPAKAKQCASPSQIATCVTDAEIGTELDKVIQAHDPSGRGLHDIWFVLLPPNVDECIAAGACGTNAFAGYHSISNVGRGEVVYSVVIDTLIEVPAVPGSDPQGNPAAESSIDTVAHETVEAITNPDGVGWMDPNGFEVADKCENGPAVGTPLGYALDGSPFNQVINGRQYLIQGMWSNPVAGCVNGSTVTTSPIPLASVSMTQFSPFISGSTGQGKAGVDVGVVVLRTGLPVARARARTRADGSWGPVRLQSVSAHSEHGVGDDRDQVVVVYGKGGPKPDLVETGNGGDPFTESGWTGWLQLDTGYRVTKNQVQLAPCSQTGVMTLRVGGATTTPPITVCSTETGTATVDTRAITAGTPLSFSSEDNRSPWLSNPNGALIKLTIGLGEPGSVSALGNASVLFNPSGFPSCTADLRAQSVRCTGLVPGTRYTLRRARGHVSRSGRADGSGAVTIGGFRRGISGGDALALTNAAGRKLTTLHVAHLQVHIKGEQTVIDSGHCEPGDYYGPAPTRPASSPGVGSPGASSTGSICPTSGHAGGLPVAHITQTDDLSGGQTRTEVPMLVGTAPADDATLYGGFTALAQTGLTGAGGSTFARGTPVALTISRGGHRVFRAANVDTVRGVRVRALPSGIYSARWVVSDANGDTRTVTTRFVEAG